MNIKTLSFFHRVRMTIQNRATTKRREKNEINKFVILLYGLWFVAKSLQHPVARAPNQPHSLSSFCSTKKKKIKKKKKRKMEKSKKKFTFLHQFNIFELCLEHVDFRFVPRLHHAHRPSYVRMDLIFMWMWDWG